VRRASLLLAAACAIATGFWVLVVTLLGTAAAPTDASADVSVEPPRPSARPPVLDHGSTERVAVAGATQSSMPGASARPDDFDACVEELTRLGLAIQTALESGQEAVVHAHNRAAEQMVAHVTTAFRDAGMLALDRLVGPPTGAAPLAGIRSRVLERLLADDLRARHARRAGRMPGPRLDPLVDAMLPFVAERVELAQALGERLLTNQPYLGPAQEPAVLDLCERTAEQPFLVDVVPGLLRTLWKNLEDAGATPGGRLRALALLFLQDPNPARRRAAATRLILDPAHRALAVAETLRSEDAGLAVAVAQAAAVDLDPTAALEILDAVAPLGGAALTPAFVTLGMRAPDTLTSAYGRALADGGDPALRGSLLTGATARLGPAAVELAELAFRSDPDRDVRSRALFALAAQADVDRAERALHDALDDPALGRDAAWLGVVSLALRNVAGRGAEAAHSRIAERLRLHPAFGGRDRRALESWLGRHAAGPR
jgi:hypothetical protein